MMNKNIYILIAEYEEDGYDFNSITAVHRDAERNIDSMPDSHARCLLHVLLNLSKGIENE